VAQSVNAANGTATAPIHQPLSGNDALRPINIAAPEARHN